MEEYIEKEIELLAKNVTLSNNNTESLDKKIQTVSLEIIKNTKDYFIENNCTTKEEIKSIIMQLYDVLYYYQMNKNGKDRMYMLGSELEKLPNIFTIDQKPTLHQIDEESLFSLNPNEGLTKQQAIELLKWTVNNTRQNIDKSINDRKNEQDSVYDNSSLTGWCGFSQFSSLYPLSEMGLKITVNNISEFGGNRHAFGTVEIPILDNGEIINKRYIIDCTYRQFFTLPFNVVSRYIHTKPDIGLIINTDSEETKFAKELLQNGFVEATKENLEKYIKPFVLSKMPYSKILQREEEIKDLDIFKILEENQEEFDYDEEEFIDWGCNLKLPTKTKQI